MRRNVVPAHGTTTDAHAFDARFTICQLGLTSVFEMTAHAQFTGAKSKCGRMATWCNVRLNTKPTMVLSALRPTCCPRLSNVGYVSSVEAAATVVVITLCGYAEIIAIGE